MNAPSIEALLSRKNVDAAHPVAKRLNDLPVVGSLARSWIRANRTSETQALWASLPPLASA